MHITSSTLRPRALGLVLLSAALLATACPKTRNTGSASPTPAPGGTPTGAVRATMSPITLPAARYRTAGAALGGNVYVLGGLDAGGAPSADVFRIEPLKAKAGPAGRLQTPTQGGAAVPIGTRVVVFGGAGGPPQDLVQQFDPATGATTVVGHLPAPRADAAATPVGNETLVLGGFDGSAPVSDVLATADGTSFHRVGSLKVAVRDPAVTVVGTTVYLFGGLVSGEPYRGTFATAVQSYNITTGLSRVAGNLPTPLAHARAAVIGGQVLVMGGWSPSGPSSAILRFDV